MLLRRSTTAAGVCLAALALCGTGRAGSVVDIDSQISGCSQCSSPPNVTTGTFLSDIFSPVQLMLGPGTYSVTNAATTGYYSAWNFEGYPNSGNWVWSFVMAADNGSGTQGTVILDDYIGGTASYPNGIYATQVLAAAASGILTYDNMLGTPTVLAGTSTAGFVDSFTLSTTTTLDFMIDDYILSDNGGGEALNITQVGGSVPEPSSFIPLGVALLVFVVQAGRLRRVGNPVPRR
jgi:hypothetical protein